MRPLPRPLAVATLVVVTGAALAGCSADDTGAPAGAPATPTSETVTTTSSAEVPGPDEAPVAVPAPVADRWRDLGGQEGALGRATGPATEVAGGVMVDFERGSIVLTPAGRAFVVQGEILAAYREAGGPGGVLGFPISDETTTDGGWVSAFEHGSLSYVDGRPVVETR